MQTKKLATILIVGVLSVLLVTFVIIQGADAGRGSSGASVGKPNTGLPNMGGLKTNAGPQQTNDGTQSGYGNAPNQSLPNPCPGKKKRGC
jgi:hypothetical protein